MKFDTTKFRLPGCIRRLRQSRQIKYVLLAVAFSVLVTGSVLAYGILSGRYEQEILPPIGVDRTIKKRDGTETVLEKKTAETTDKEAEPDSGATEQPALNSGEDAAQKPPVLPETSQEQTNTEKPNNTEALDGTEKPDPGMTNTDATEQPALNSGEDAAQKPPTLPETSQEQTNTEKPNNTENLDGTEKPDPGTENTEPPATEQPGTIAPETDPPVMYDPDKNTAPDFTVLDANGKKTRLSDNFGKPIVINFWATWCPPCKRELPDFDKLCTEYGDKVVFMMVNLTDGRRDTVDGTKKFISKNGYTFPVYFDTEYNGADAYNVSSIPQTTFIDANGNVYTTRIGAMNETVLRSYINALLEG